MTAPDTSEPTTNPPAVDAAHDARMRRINEMARRLQEEEDNSKEWLRAGTFGALDGASSTVGLVAGMAGAGAAIPAIAVASTAALVSGATSMGAGEYFSVLADAERVHKMFADIRTDIDSDADHAAESFAAALVSKFDTAPEDAFELASRVHAAPPDVRQHVFATYAMGEFADEPPSPRSAAVASFASFGVGSALSTLPYVGAAFDVIPDGAALPMALAGTAVGLFGAGAYASRYSPRSGWVVGARQLVAGGITGGVSYALAQGITKVAEAGGVDSANAGLWAVGLGVLMGAGTMVVHRVRGRRAAREREAGVASAVEGARSDTATLARAARHNSAPANQSRGLPKIGRRKEPAVQTQTRTPETDKLRARLGERSGDRGARRGR